MDVTKLNIAAMINAGLCEQRVAIDGEGGTYVGVAVKPCPGDAEACWHITRTDANGNSYVADRASLTANSDLFTKKWTLRGSYNYSAT